MDPFLMISCLWNLYVYRKLRVMVIALLLKHAPTIWPFQLKKSQMEILASSVLHLSATQIIKKNSGQLCWYIYINFGCCEFLQ